MSDELPDFGVTEVDPVQINLTGGPHDGEGFTLAPNLAISIPDALEFFASDGKQAGWERYERWPSPGWPTDPQKYNHTGFRPMLTDDEMPETSEPIKQKE